MARPAGTQPAEAAAFDRQAERLRLRRVCWIVLTWLFGIYVEQFGNYNVTYGSVGAIVVFVTWLYLSSYALLLGAELNAEFEIAAVETAGTATPGTGTQYN